jgi:hypothetical protein
MKRKLPGWVWVTGLVWILATLKSWGLVDWSWWTVFAPVWVPAAFFAGCLALILASALIGFGIATGVRAVAQTGR